MESSNRITRSISSWNTVNFLLTGVGIEIERVNQLLPTMLNELDTRPELNTPDNNDRKKLYDFIINDTIKVSGKTSTANSLRTHIDAQLIHLNEFFAFYMG